MAFVMNDDNSALARKYLLENVIYKREYEAAFEALGQSCEREWEDLTHEERLKVKEVCIKHQRWMDRLGNAISNDTPLPSPFED